MTLEGSSARLENPREVGHDGQQERVHFTGEVHGAGEVHGLGYVARVYGEVFHPVRVPEEAVPPQNIVLRWHVLMGTKFQVAFPARRFVLATQIFFWRIDKQTEPRTPQIAYLAKIVKNSAEICTLTKRLNQLSWRFRPGRGINGNGANRARWLCSRGGMGRLFREYERVSMSGYVSSFGCGGPPGQYPPGPGCPPEAIERLVFLR